MISCKPDHRSVEESENFQIPASWYIGAVEQLSDVIVHDIFSPPVASRVYVYPCIAGYEAAIPSSNAISFGNRLHGLNEVDLSNEGSVNYDLAAIYAFLGASKDLVFSPQMFQSFEDSLLGFLNEKKIHPEVLKQSEEFGKNISRQIMNWASEDNYNQSRSFPKFNVTDEPGRWRPTPPAYMEAIEPHWREIRTMVIDSAAQFRVEPPALYSEETGSKYFELVNEVKEAVENASEEEKLIASFWDCNPYVMNQRGHLMFATKKITPGGHWMGITGVACRTSKANIHKSLEAYAHTSIALFDGFIACWDEKYRSNYIRPETFINEFIDDQWLPVLQTPPFPEHTSGHSVISTAAATVLTAVFGENFSFTDDVELKYGLPTRDFGSFIEASQEAAISRLYGGIHFMPAITEGVAQGDKVGQKIISDLNL